MDKKAYFFDMDGTLVDSMPRAWSDVIFKYLDDRGVSYSKDIIAEIVTKGFMAIANYYVEVLGVKDEPQIIYDYFMDGLKPLYVSEFDLKKGAPELIKKLKSEGHSVNVISGSPHRFVDPCLKRHNVFDLFDNVWSVEDFNLSKSDKKLYQELSKKVGVKPSNCVLIDDSIGAIKTAKSTGFYTIGIFEAIVEKYWNEVKSTADETILDFTELL